MPVVGLYLETTHFGLMALSSGEHVLKMELVRGMVSAAQCQAKAELGAARSGYCMAGVGEPSTVTADILV